MKNPRPLALSAFLVVGTLSAQTQLYWGGGSVDISNNTTIPTGFASLSGTWDTSTKNWANSPTNPNTYQAWTTGAIFNGSFGFTAANGTETSTITLANDFTAGGLNVQLTGTTNSNQAGKSVIFSSSSAKTLTLADNAVVNVTTTSPGAFGQLFAISNTSGTGVSLAGNGFTKTGNSILRFDGSQNMLTGTVNITQDATLSTVNSPGVVWLNAGATLAGVTRFNLSASGLGSTERANLQVNAATGKDQLNDNAVINLSGLATLDYRGAAGTTETTGSLRLDSAGTLTLASGAGTNTLTFTNGIVRANNRAQLLVIETTAGVMTSTVNLGSSPGLGSSVLPWASDSRGRFMQVDGSNNLVAATTTTDVTSAASVISSSIDYRIVGDSTTITGAAATFASGAQANSLGFYRGTSGTLTVTATLTDTLTITSGGLAVGNDANRGDLTITGGTSLTTSNGNALYVNTGSSSTGSMIIQTPITGNIDVAKNGVPALIFGGAAANTYTGTTYVNGGLLALSKTGNAASIKGDVVIRNGGTLRVDTASQIATTSTVTIEKGGYFITHAAVASPTIKALVGGGMLQADTGNATFTVTESVSVGDGGIGTFINDRGAALTAANFVMASGAVFNIELAGDGTSADKMAFYNFKTGEFVLNNNAINLSLVGTQAAGTYTVSLFTFFSDSGLTATNSSIVGGLINGTLGAGITAATLNYNSGGTSIDLTYTVAAVPEPSTVALIAGLLVGCVAVYRRRR
jgi:autotransporter-associated beta strand protein